MLAGRIGTGTLFGADCPGLPADRRFYAGRRRIGARLRLQAVGPEDGLRRPRGAEASLLEGSVELAPAVSAESFGVRRLRRCRDGDRRFLVPATDDLRLGAGIGIRYFTGFGPVRADIGVPA